VLCALFSFEKNWRQSADSSLAIITLSHRPWFLASSPEMLALESSFALLAQYYPLFSAPLNKAGKKYYRAIHLLVVTERFSQIFCRFFADFSRNIISRNLLGTLPSAHLIKFHHLFLRQSRSNQRSQVSPY
jgi:hypothetical protein